MYSFSTIVLALVSTAVAAPNALPNRTPTVYLAGDSTMAEGGGGSGTQGQKAGDTTSNTHSQSRS